MQKQILFIQLAGLPIIVNTFIDYVQGSRAQVYGNRNPNKKRR